MNGLNSPSSPLEENYSDKKGKINSKSEYDLPWWINIWIPHGLEIYVPKGCASFFIGLPWWLGIIFALGMAPILIWFQLLDVFSPNTPGSVFLSNVICIYPLLIPICMIASILLFRRTHYSLSKVLAAIPLFFGLIVTVTYFSLTSAKYCLSVTVDSCVHSTHSVNTEFHGTVTSSCTRPVRKAKITTLGHNTYGEVIARVSTSVYLIEPSGTAGFDDIFSDPMGKIINCTATIESAIH